jgi:hypothetical protein
MGMNFYATGGTAKFMAENNVKAELLHWPLEDENRRPRRIQFS